MNALVGIDLRASGHEWLLERAGLYAGRIGARVDLVYFLGEGSEAPGHRKALEALLSLLPPECRGVARVEQEAPAEGLVRLSGEYAMLVVGSREPPALERLLHGPMATRVLRQAKCPVLVPRGEHAPRPMPKILLGVDVEGPEPTAVLRWANLWAARLQGTVHAMYAAAAHRGEFSSLKEDKQRKLQALLDQYIAAPNRGTVQIKRGEPDEALIELSREYDLVLVGNREREGLARIMLGTVAAQVVRRSSCDVLSLPTATSTPP
jgi:nucleotide-binding universal stress UspA family protein